MRALLLQVLYTVRSERLLMEELDYNLLFRWFVGLNMDDPVWYPTTFTKNRDRLLGGEVAAAFFDAVGRQARPAGLLSDEHFTVDGTQLETWASLKSFRPRKGPAGPPADNPGNPTVNFRGERRRNDTHQSATDPQARLYRKGPGREAAPAYLGHVLLDNRHGLVANVCVTAATGRPSARRHLDAGAERAAGEHDRRRQRLRRGALRRRRPRTRGDPAHRAQGPVQRHRRSHHVPPGLPGQSAEAEARRAGVWLDEDRGRLAEAAPPWWRAGRLDPHLRGGRVQPGAIALLGGDVSLITERWRLRTARGCRLGLAHHGTVLREIRSNAFENAHRAGFFSSLLGRHDHEFPAEDTNRNTAGVARTSASRRRDVDKLCAMVNWNKRDVRPTG